MSQAGRRGGRPTLRAIACMRLQRNARQKGGKGKKYYPPIAGVLLVTMVWKDNHMASIETKRVGRSGQSTQTKRGHEPGVLVHYATPNQF